jgi:hypothetical protein
MIESFFVGILTDCYCHSDAATETIYIFGLAGFFLVRRDCRKLDIQNTLWYIHLDVKYLDVSKYFLTREKLSSFCKNYNYK